MSGANSIILGNVSFGPARSLWEEQPSLRELYDQACQGLVRAECEVEELRAEVALLLEERNILGTASLSKALRGTTVTKAAVTEGAEPSCNDSAQVFRERPEPPPHLSDTPETEAHSPWRYAINANGVTTHYVPADFARKLERERDEARMQYRTTELLAMALLKTIDELKAQVAGYRDDACRESCRDKAAADGGWANI
jgi:hypothetical protein